MAYITDDPKLLPLRRLLCVAENMVSTCEQRLAIAIEALNFSPYEERSRRLSELNNALSAVTEAARRLALVEIEDAKALLVRIIEEESEV